MNIDTIIPKMVTSLSGTTINQTSDDSKREQSHKNAAATKIIIRIGSCATVIMNMANGGPNARKAHPKNSGKVIVVIGNSIKIKIKRNCLSTLEVVSTKLYKSFESKHDELHNKTSLLNSEQFKVSTCYRIVFTVQCV